MWLGFAALVGYLAKQRGRSGLGWFALAVAVSPLVAFPLLMTRPDLMVQEFLETVSQDLEVTHVKCVHCAEYVLPEAKVCKYCGGALIPQTEQARRHAAEKMAEAEEAIAERQHTVLIWAGIVTFIVVGAWVMDAIF
jgi:hypothetical protein